MKIRAVAQVGEDVLLFGERRLAHPGHPFPAHLGVDLGITVHPPDHVMTTNARHAARAFRQAGRGVVRTARTEPWLALFHHARTRQRLFAVADECQARIDTGAHVFRQIKAQQPRGNGTRHHRGRKLVVRRQQPVALRHRPFAAILVVELANHARNLLAAADPTEQLFLQLVFQHLALFLNHQDLVQPFRKLLRAGGFQRPHHAHLEQAQTDALAHRFRQAQVRQRLARVQIRLARRHDAKARIALRHMPQFAVELVGARVGQRRVQLVVQEPRLLLQGRIRQADVQAVGRQQEILGQQNPHALRIHVDRGRYLDDIGDALHADPHARVAAHRPAVQAVVQHLLDAGRKQHRNHAGLQDVVALVRQGG
ncbi:hypothetical protein D3C72_472230 [compost metagenome]